MMKKNIRQCLFLIAGIALLALFSHKYSFRIDLTAEKRYTLSPETRQILRQLDAPLHLNVYLEGDMPAGFRKLRNGIREILDDFKRYAGSRLSCDFIDPSEAVEMKEREQFYAELEETGVRKITVSETNRDGSLSQQTLFPGAVASCGNRMSAINFLNNNGTLSPDRALNASLEGIEYELIKTIRTLSADSIEKIAFITGHGELGRAETYDLGLEYANYYDVDRKTINGKPDALDHYKAVIVAKPKEAFDERDKFVIDRYIMRGGKVIWLIDAVEVNTDSLFSSGLTFALASSLNLEDQLFTYGVRINPHLVQDMANHPIVVTLADGSSNPVPVPWLYHPLVNASPAHVVTRYLNPVWLRYAGDIDTVGTDSGIRKTVLLRTSQHSRTKAAPFMIYLNERIPEQEQFNRPHRITAVLLEGKFPSVFRSRSVKNMFPDLNEPQATVSVDTKMAVVSDGDIARNDVRNTLQGAVPAQPLGYDRYSRRTFANKDFLVNVLNYLTDDAGVMKLRNREFQLRLLDRQKVNRELLKWQIINVLLPVLIWICGGIACGIWRRRKYGRPATPIP
ncbi:MAG: gliding motility-associated ABC transporter substrate-binding protein GldG [Bacteroidales bacterium]|jgi:ABC-2 type transport system permease protein|nr:gliding motility-associated ABC transporter substrate-binding protein GldG [Bacteroidales bacterium]